MNADEHRSERDSCVLFCVYRWFISVFPSVAIIGICCGLPLIWIVFTIASNPAVYVDVHLSSFRGDLLLRTLGYNFCAAIIATLMGIPAGLLLGRGRGIFAKSLWFIVPAALFMPSLAFAYGWTQAVRLATPLWDALGIRFIPAGPADVMRCIWTLAAWLWAVPACVIGLSLRRMDTAVQQQATLDGALMRVTLRQLLSPIIISLCTITILAMQEFSVYEPTGISVVATEVRMVFDTGAFSSLANPIAGSVPAEGVTSTDQSARAAAAIATAVPLLVITLALAGISVVAANRMATGDEINTGNWPRVLDAPRWASVLSTILLLLNLALPITSLIVSLRTPLSPTHIWSEFAPAVSGSMLVGCVAGVIGVIASLSACVRWPRGVLLVAAVGFLVGGQILAIAMIRITNRPGLLLAYDSLVLPAIAYVGRFGWLALIGARSTWSKPWRELREMAALDGAGPFRVACSIVIPLAWPMVLAGCVLLGALSLTEVPATVLLSPQNPQVLTPMLMTWVHMARFDPMIEASLLMIAMVLVPVVIAMGMLFLSRRVYPLHAHLHIRRGLRG